MGGDGTYLLEQLFSLVHGWDVDSSANPCNCGAHVYPPLPVANHFPDFPHRFLYITTVPISINSWPPRDGFVLIE